MFKQSTFLEKQGHPNVFPAEKARAPKWFVVDASGIVLGRLATTLARVITGRHKATYTPHVDTGDFVVVLNAEKIVLTGRKWDQKKYHSHSGHVGGLHSKTATEMRASKPEEMVRQAVWGMTNKSKLATRQMAKLKIYAGDKHPHLAQGPKSLPAGALRRSGVASSRTTKSK